MPRMIRKITVEISSELLEKAMLQTKKNLTETIRKGLDLLVNSSTYKELKEFKGRLNFN